MLGVVGRKVGMTRVFNEQGVHVPVTVIEVTPNRITQLKTIASDGYSAVQITAGSRRASLVTKPEQGHFAKAGVEAGRISQEFRIGEQEVAALSLGGEITADIFSAGQMVDVTGISIGKGFQGVVKRWHVGGGRKTHGASLVERAPGSIGQRQTPGRTFKNMKMAGHMGAVQRTIQNLQVVRVDAEKNLLLVRGGVPGSEGSHVTILPAIKKQAKA